MYIVYIKVFALCLQSSTPSTHEMSFSAVDKCHAGLFPENLIQEDGLFGGLAQICEGVGEVELFHCP
jgi:hypothetical protein